MKGHNNQKLLQGHGDEISCISFSLYGELLKSGQKEKNIWYICLEYKTGKVIYTFSEHNYEISFLTFSTDDKLLFIYENIQDKSSFIWVMRAENIILNLTSILPLPTVFVKLGEFVSVIIQQNIIYI